MTSPVNVLVISKPGEHLRVLDSLKASANLTITTDMAQLTAAAPEADVILNGMFNGDLLRAIFPSAKKMKWVHTLSAGVEAIVFPELIASPVPFTNGRGVFRQSLGEFVIAAAFFFAKDLRRMVRSQEAGRWEQFDVDELHGSTMGIVGLGEIGRAAAERAKALGMRVIAIRRRPDLSGSDSLLDGVYPPSELHALLRESDYVVVAAPNTPSTKGMIGEAEFAVMKPTAVIINVGRGPVIVESAIIKALQERRIRGAALDVFDEEPIPAGHPFWTLDNLLLSPHCADHTVGWLELAVNMFVRNFEHFIKGEPLENIVDKQAGY